MVNGRPELLTAIPITIRRSLIRAALRISIRRRLRRSDRGNREGAAQCGDGQQAEDLFLFELMLVRHGQVILHLF